MATYVLAWSALLVTLVSGIVAMGIFSSRNKFPVDGKTVVITGGSQGMGRGLAKQFAQKGANVVIVARNRAKLDEALQYISAAAVRPAQQRFHAISADVTKPEENNRILEEVIAWNKGQEPDIVWANAGAAHPKLFTDTSIDVLRYQMDINYWAAAYLAHATLKTWQQPASESNANARFSPREPRHFIMTSSVIVFVGLAGYAPYAPAKAAMRGLADSLRSEVLLYNGARQRSLGSGPATDVEVHIVLPGTILSPGLDVENESKHPVTSVLEEGDPAQTEDEVAAAALKGLEKGHFMITTQYLGTAMKASSLGGSARDSFLETMLSWVTGIAWHFIGPDMDRKVFNYGRKNGVTSTPA